MRKEELHHDPIREIIVKSVSYIQDNRNTVLKLFASLFILVAAISFYNHTGSIKVENSSNIAGLAQNTFINGEIDEALVKFERVLNDYPNTYGATQSLIYLLNDAITNEDQEAITNLISQHNGGINNIDDPVLRAAIYKIQGDLAISEDNTEYALSNYQKAESNVKASTSQIAYKLAIIAALLAQEDYNNAKNILEDILNMEDVGYNEKNMAEEYLAYVHHKMGI